MKMRAIVGLALVTLLSGCTSASNTDAKPEAKVSVATIDPARATVLKPGDDLKVVADLPRKVGKQNAYFDSFTEDGELLGSVSLPEPAPNDGSMGPIESQGHPMMYDINTKRMTILDNRKRPQPTWVGSVIGTKNVVVWIEGSDTTVDIGDFVVYAYDRRSKKVQQIAKFSDQHGKVVYGNDLAVRGGLAYLSRLVYPNKKGLKPAVYEIPVDGSKAASILIHGGQEITLDGDTLTYSHGRARFNRSLKTGETTPTPTSSYASKPGFCGAEFTETFESWCLGRKMYGNAPPGFADARLTIKEKSGRTTTFRPFPTDSANYPTPHHLVALGGWIGITMTDDDGANREFLVDLTSDAIKVFPKGTSFGPANTDGSLALLNTPSKTGPWPQRVVQIPTA